MASLFRSLEGEDLTDDEKPIFDVLKASLYYPTTPDVLAQRLSDDIVFFCRSASGDEDYEAILIIVWNIAFDIVGCIPPDHEWQDIWANTLKILQGRENLPPRDENMRDGLSWQELPWFLEQQRMSLDQANADDDTKWKNLTSFATRLYASGVTRTHLYPVSEFRETLEKYDSIANVPEGAMWVASEWVIRCADRILDFMLQSGEPKGEREEALWRFGDAYAGKEGVGLLSVERWSLWKKWFSDEKEKLSGDNSELVNPVLLFRVSEALEKMNDAEKNANWNRSPDGVKGERGEPSVAVT